MKSFSSSDGCSIRGVPYLQASQPTKKFPRRAIEQLICALPNKLSKLLNHASRVSSARKKVSADGTQQWQGKSRIIPTFKSIQTGREEKV